MYPFLTPAIPGYVILFQTKFFFLINNYVSYLNVLFTNLSCKYLWNTSFPRFWSVKNAKEVKQQLVYLCILVFIAVFSISK